MGRLATLALLVMVLTPWQAAHALEPADKCEVDKLKAAATYFACRLKAELKGIKKGEAPDFSRCNEKYDSKWSKIETKAEGACSTSGDGDAVGGLIRDFSSSTSSVLEPSVFLIIDEDAMDNGTNCSASAFATDPNCVSIEECASGGCPGVTGPPIDESPAALVNDDIASVPGVPGCESVLRINSVASLASMTQAGMPSITLPTGQIGDEGLFAPATDAFVLLPGKLPGFIHCDPKQVEDFLGGLAGTPLNAASITALEGRRVCGVLYDSDVSDLGGGLLNAKGARGGRTAFQVKSVLIHPNDPNGDSLLPVLEIDVLGAKDVDAACECSALETVDGQPYECPCVPLDSCEGLCGNGISDVDCCEECDDANNDNDDGCSELCILEFCGDGILQAGIGETCDDAGESASCDVDCTPVECGDGTLNVTSGEECDDGNILGGDGCSSSCQLE